jgi:hypothetical protein
MEPGTRAIFGTKSLNQPTAFSPGRIALAPLQHRGELSVEMKEAIAGVVSTCFQTILRDDPWQDFGFPKRPKYGALVQKFRSTWKVELEKTILKEMIIVLTAAHVVAQVVSQDEIEKVVDAYTSSLEVIRSLGYASRNEAQIHLRKSIEDYVKSSPDQWCGMLFKRIDPNSLSDQKVAARLVLGCAQFGTTAQNMVGILRQRIT